MIDATAFSLVNVGIGFVVSWLLGHYLLPVICGINRHAGRATVITVIFTIAALIRNFGVYWIWTNG